MMDAKSQYEEYIERILIAFYKAHQDSTYPGVRAHGLPGIILAVKADIVSKSEWRTSDFSTSQKRWNIVAALHELMDRGYIKCTEDEHKIHRHPDEWNFRLTPEGKGYAHQLLSKAIKGQGAFTHQVNIAESVKVFVSSTWADLQPEREALEKALHRMCDTTFVEMEFFSSRPEIPKKTSLAEVDQSNVYIGIFAYRYDSEKTESEYRRAMERGIPCLIYLKDEGVPKLSSTHRQKTDEATQLVTLKKELKSQHTVSFFDNPDQLTIKVIDDLNNLLRDSHLVREETPAQPGQKYQINISDSQGILIGDQTKVVQNFEAIPFSTSLKPDVILLQNLVDSIRHDLTLLQDYEDALHNEDEPAQRQKYLREINQLNQFSVDYRQVYDKFLSQIPDKSLQVVKEIGKQLELLDRKLYALLSGQSEILAELKDVRKSVLAHFNTGLQSIVTQIIEQLDQNQLVTIESVLTAIDEVHVSEIELQESLSMIQQLFYDIQQGRIVFQDPALLTDAKNISEAISEPRLDVRHRLKLTVPIIPVLLAYEGELELSNGMNLEEVWKQVIAKFRG